MTNITTMNILQSLDLDNGQRIFQVTTSVGKSAFCNLHHLNDVIDALDTHEGYFKIYHYWDNKPKKITKKHLRDMFEAHRMEMKFPY